MPPADFLRSYLNTLKGCTADNICGLSLNPLYIKGVTLTIDRLSDGSNAKCQMAAESSFAIHGIPNMGYSITDVDSTANQISFSMKITLNLNSTEIPFDCTISRPSPPPPPNNLVSELVKIPLSIFQYFGLFKPPIPTPSTNAVNLVVNKFYYNISGSFRAVIVNSTETEIVVLSTPIAEVSSIETFGSASELLQQTTESYLNDYLVSEIVRMSIFEDVRGFYINVIQTILDYCK
ncbi:hypothetical protein CHUAL_005462 [Chamberlinius hualienensis]